MRGQLGAERLGRWTEPSLSHVDVAERGLRLGNIGLERDRPTERRDGLIEVSLRGMDLTDDDVQLRHVWVLRSGRG